ncbi:MAG: hypothetical protein HQ567_28160 [Candidatus Nealsonbacteria bacterium]|nr:hypothetical protein [Candidatus Nealsonbacteria bacterium]
MEDPPTAAPRGGLFRFSLLALLIFTAVNAATCSLLFASPGWVRFCSIMIFAFAFSTVWVAAMVYGRGYLRTFAIGALCSAAAGTLFAAFFLAYMSLGLMTSNYPSSWDSWAEEFEHLKFEPALATLIFFGLNIFTGLLGVTTRWLIESSRRL